MIKVILSKNDFEYDIRSLIKAFYPTENLLCEVDEPDSKSTFSNENINEYNTSIGIQLGSDTICIILKRKDNDDIIRSKEVLNDNRKEYKNTLKRLLYNLLVDITGNVLPWGTLTGIRPTKIPMEHLMLGHSDNDIRNYMKNEYLCSDEKIQLSLDITKREFTILNDLDYQNGYSIYIGIPFCPTTCLYCSFTSYSIEKYIDYVEGYLEALFKEIDYASNCYTDRRLTTIYLGGGTPTTLTAPQLERLLIKIKTTFPMDNVREFTVEAGRPDSITEEKLKVLKEQGVSRISINPQTMNQRTLDIIGRKHTTKQIEDAFSMARKLGHENINMDLILGLPGESIEDVTNTLKVIGRMNPDSLTIHTLAVKRAATLNIKRELYHELAPKDVKSMLRLAMDFSSDYKYEPYYLYRQKNMMDNLENIGFAKKGKEGIYNILIMEEKHTILALGAGASSKIVSQDGTLINRIENVKSVKDYIERIDEMIERKKRFFLNQ